LAVISNQTDEQKKNDSAFQSLHALRERWKEGTFREIIDDWKWIFSYSARYKGAIIFYTLLGIVSTSLGLVGSVVSKYLIDIITGHKVEMLAVMIIILIGSSLISLAFNSIINRVSTRLSIYINNDIQADIHARRRPEPFQQRRQYCRDQCDQLAADDHQCSVQIHRDFLRDLVLQQGHGTDRFYQRAVHVHHVQVHH